LVFHLDEDQAARAAALSEIDAIREVRVTVSPT
jgi:hypothetical protein